MGTIQHKALVVTGADYGTDRKFTHAYNKAKKLFPKKLLSPKLDAVMNGYSSFFIAPCGSKLGWEEDTAHDEAISKMIEYLEALKYDDGSTAVKYVYVTFGELGLTVQDYMGHDVYEEEKE